jgi:hypothetical protein
MGLRKHYSVNPRVMPNVFQGDVADAAEFEKNPLICLFRIALANKRGAHGG